MLPGNSDKRHALSANLGGSFPVGEQQSGCAEWYVPRFGLWTRGHDTSCLASMSLRIKSLPVAFLTDK